MLSLEEEKRPEQGVAKAATQISVGAGQNTSPVAGFNDRMRHLRPPLPVRAEKEERNVLSRTNFKKSSWCLHFNQTPGPVSKGGLSL